jgi:N-ethylmaleimide reductase
MTTLFDPIQVGAMALSNRVVMAPLTRNRAPGNMPTALLAEYYGQRAHPTEGAGLIINEATCVSAQGQGYPDTPGIWSAEQVDAWKASTQAVHAAGGKIALQLWHVGRISHTELQPGKASPVAPSAIAAKTKTFLFMPDGSRQFVPVSEPRALELAEIPGIVAAFAQGAKNAMAAGFDAVEIHGANGYLLDQFLKTGANQRTDEYGGSMPNRARLMLEVLDAVIAATKQAKGPGRVGIRLAPVTPANGIIDDNPQALFEYLLAEMAQRDVAFIHIIEGSTGGPREVDGRPFDYAALKAAYKAAGGKAAWMVNNGYDKPLADKALAEGDDLVAFGVPFISNPDLTRRLREDLPWTPAKKELYYGGGAEGYTDYPRFGA